MRRWIPHVVLIAAAIAGMLFGPQETEAESTEWLKRGEYFNYIARQSTTSRLYFQRTATDPSTSDTSFNVKKITVLNNSGGVLGMAIYTDGTNAPFPGLFVMPVLIPAGSVETFDGFPGGIDSFQITSYVAGNTGVHIVGEN